MSTVVLEQGFTMMQPVKSTRSLITQFRRATERKLSDGLTAIRFVVTETTQSKHECETGAISGPRAQNLESIFYFRRRSHENTAKFTVALLVPTGVGAEIGGHAGDAGPAARLLAQVADTLILHPNVVNASDINEMPENSLYVEGSVVCRLLMGTAGLQPVRANRVLVVIDAHPDELFVNAAANAVNGARATYGLQCPEIVCLDPPVKLRARHSAMSGRAVGRIEDLDGLCQVLNARRGTFDAVALASVIDVPNEYHQGYFDAAGDMVNPWGGVEAMLTHALSSIYDVPTAHSPMFESREIADMDPGIVDPRMAAEAVSGTFLQCTLKGLQRSPRIVTDRDRFAGERRQMDNPEVLTAADVSCLVIPDGCLGLPTLAALEQGIRVIAVRENRNLMKNDLAALPWQPGQFHRAANYWEAIGILAAMRAGIDPGSVRRPIEPATMTRFAPKRSSTDGKEKDSTATQATEAQAATEEETQAHSD